MRARFTDLVPWGLGSGAAHVVLAVLLGMSDLARPPEGDMRPDGTIVETVGPEAVVRLDTPPEFLRTPTPEGAFLPPPTTEIEFPREFPEPEEHPDPCECCFVCPGRCPDSTPPDLDPRTLSHVRLAPTAGTPGEGAVLAALRWLARHQAADGTWKARYHTERCHEECPPSPGHEDFDVGVTALALLAFSRAGYHAASTDVHEGISFGTVVRDAISALVGKQDPAGCIGSREAQKYMYNHILATLALAEATRHSLLFRREVRRAAEFLLRARNPGKGWRYSFRCGDNDTSLTCWATLALLAAEPFLDEGPDRDAHRDALAWLDEVTDETYGHVGYTHRGTGKVFVPSLGDNFDHHETLTALAAVVRWRLQGTRSTGGADPLYLVLRDKPRWSDPAIDFLYWHAGTLALKTLGHERDPRWIAWKDATLQALLPHQKTRGCLDGSWDPVDQWGGEGGRVYATAINALTLQLLAE